MKKSLALTNKDGEVRELTAEDMSSFKSAKAALPASLAKTRIDASLRQFISEHPIPN